jgi:hypothetical protein
MELVISQAITAPSSSAAAVIDSIIKRALA